MPMCQGNNNNCPESALRCSILSVSGNNEVVVSVTESSRIHVYGESLPVTLMLELCLSLEL